MKEIFYEVINIKIMISFLINKNFLNYKNEY